MPDSEGPGRWRGGLGLRRDYVFEGDVTFSVMAERVEFAPQGLFGGGAARSTHYIREPGAAPAPLPVEVLASTSPAGEVMSIQIGGGGGYGAPLERDPDAVAADVASGRISRAGRPRVYGVVLGRDGGPTWHGRGPSGGHASRRSPR